MRVDRKAATQRLQSSVPPVLDIRRGALEDQKHPVRVHAEVNPARPESGSSGDLRNHHPGQER